jgi:hypothetical protein
MEHDPHGAAKRREQARGRTLSSLDNTDAAAEEAHT